MSFLTRREQMLVAFVLVVFVAGLGIKHWRDLRSTGHILATEQARP